MTGAQTYVIGTAGHVDHGKSTLVKVLTGIDPDRLREEKEREMTIDLGFAWLELPGGRRVSVVDVPGHERFIKNMLAGVGGIDAALLVVAADEGPMPQTEEHLHILDLLQIPRGLVVLTKVDLVDREWRELVAEETREKLRGSVLQDAPCVAVSSLTGEGLDDLRSAIARMLDAVPPRAESGRPRLPIDRVFTIQGFGTVVTGTLLDGALEVGQEVEIQPDGLHGRVRGLQSHHAKTDRAYPGSRTAVNLSGLAVEQLARGQVMTVPGWLTGTRVLDARLRLVADSPVVVEQNDAVDFFVGSSETPAHVTLLDRESLAPGEDAWVQLRFETPVVVVKGDRFIVRRPSPGLTIGGGVVVDAHPRRHRRFRPEVIAALEVLERGSPREIVERQLDQGPVELRRLLAQVALPETEVRAALDELLANGQVLALRRPAGEGALPPTVNLMSAGAYQRMVARLCELLGSYHARNPLRRGMSREEVRTRLGLPARPFDEFITRVASGGAITDEGETLRLPRHRINFTPEQRQRIDRFLTALRAAPYTPPAPADFGLDQALVAALGEVGEIVRLDDGIVFARSTFDEIERQVLAYIDTHGSITLAQFRDLFGSSRRYAQVVLESFDQRRVTRRVGDERIRYGG